MIRKIVVILICFSFIGLDAQKHHFDTFFQKSDSLNYPRFITSTSFAAASYTGFSIGLYHAWYKNFEQESFHLYNDSGEWRNMDKLGHFYTAYFQGVLCYKGAKWTGLNENQSIQTGFVLGTLFQSTLELMDGFSSKWGFSLPDMGMNLAGSGVFVLQQKIWSEQRISFKVSNFPKAYPDIGVLATNGETTTTLDQRAEQLFGSSFPERFLKDYNSQVLWASINLDDFLGDYLNIPSWFNIAIGYGAGNMYGGYENRWTTNDAEFILPSSQFKRYSSIYLSPDINLSKIRTKSYLFNTLLDMADIFKLPLPAIEYNTLGEWHFHWRI